jgi:two-component system nitrogen regulation response regulator NtrX
MAHDILIVDDEADIRVLTAGILEDEGYQTREAANSATALAAVETRRPSLVLLDIWLHGSDLDGLGILKVVKESHPTVPVVMMSGHGTIETAVAAIRDGAYDFIEKPFKADRMILVVERAIEAMRLRRENEELRLRAGAVDDLLGRSAAIAQVRQAIERVAPTNSRVLISGPPGSGKEVAARMLHLQSRRRQGPFVVVNCAILDPDRFEVELFGVENAAGESGARKVGTFEQAHGGTLFLDEIADMPLETQAKIVRVLQEQTFLRVGGATRVEVDVRVVAATAKDLNQLIADGGFRQDLFYRLSVVPVQLPPLLGRREDIPLLAGFFMERVAAALGQPPRSFGADAMAAMQTHIWPGNVRELRNVVERLMILSNKAPGEPVRVDALPAEIVDRTPAALKWEKGAEIMGLPLREARELFEREYLFAQVERFDGNISRTAEFVGMERSALHRKLRSLGMAEGDRRRPLRR